MRKRSANVATATRGPTHVDHFGNTTGRGVITDAGQLAVIAWLLWF
ncbi:hypothetical protein [Lysinibacillus sphaericus]|nr:hypothetical protein [Lysinibacillus sphaericus]